jgi:poly-gamma-glutamate synthesis protein (capsule biosynthesis protein)
MSRVSLFLAGDVMTGRGIDQVMRHPGDPTLYEPWVKSAVEYVHLAEQRNGPIPRGVEPEYIWGDALGVLDKAGVDVRIINLETTVTDRGEAWPAKDIHYRMHPDNLGCIEVARIDCCVLANNHVLDWSHEGLTQTLQSLHATGLGSIGAGRDLDEARTPRVITTALGGRVLVLGLGHPSSGIPASWSAGPDRPGVALAESLSANVGELADLVQKSTGPGDLVVVSIHWGPNWGYDIPETHKRFARSLIDQAGVHIVHGHSSHHALGIEVHHGRPILYSCGDLINDYEGIQGHEQYHPELGIAYLLDMDTGAGRLESFELVPMRRRRFRLEHVPTEEVDWLAGVLARESEPLGTRITRVGERLLVGW